jgi:class 3 adenylate cyclase
MSWNYETSLERVKRHLESMGEIEIEDLVREADLHSLLSETCCRTIFGAHVYIDVPNFSVLATDIDGEEYRRVLQAVHLYQREVSRIVERSELFDALRVHFQGPRLHALIYRPIHDEAEIASRAVLLQAVMKDFVRRVFNPAYPSLSDISVSGGADIGNAVGTQDGMKGDRELLFLGAPANYAAKIIGSAGQMRLTARVHSFLPKALQDFCQKLEDGTYVLSPLNGEQVEALANDLGIEWSAKDSSERIQEDKRTYPLKDIEYGDADTLIDPDTLGINSNKKVLAASVFADVDKFTAYIDQSKKVQEKKDALRLLHVIRKELAAVVKHDFGVVRVQYQGDRVQALIHLPKADEEKIIEKAFDIACALQSSLEITVKKCLPEAALLGLAVGIDLGDTLVSKLGIRGDRDRICIGLAVQNAAAVQEACHALEIGVNSQVVGLLKSEHAKLFELDEDRGIHVAYGLTAEKIERASKAAAFGAPVFVSSRATGVSITSSGLGQSREVLPSRSYAN